MELYVFLGAAIVIVSVFFWSHFLIYHNGHSISVGFVEFYSLLVINIFRFLILKKPLRFIEAYPSAFYSSMTDSEKIHYFK